MAETFSGGSVNHWHYLGNGATATSSSTGIFAAGNGTYNTTEHGNSTEITAHAETGYSGTRNATESEWELTQSGNGLSYEESTSGNSTHVTWGTATTSGNTTSGNTTSVNTGSNRIP